ncbi:MAG: ASCH domain-containing protein, partial [Aeromonas sp.]
AFDELNDTHAQQENMTLTELKAVIRAIYPTLPPLYVIEFKLIN